MFGSSGFFLVSADICYEGNGLQHGKESKEGEATQKKQINKLIVLI
jgi:hypothetical protein